MENSETERNSVLQVLNSFYIEHGGEKLESEHLFNPKNCLLICIAFLKGLNLQEETFLATETEASEFLKKTLASNPAYANLDLLPEMVDSFAVINVFAIMRYLLEIVDFEKQTGFHLNLANLYRGSEDFLMALYTNICHLYLSFKSADAIFEDTVNDAVTKKEQQQQMNDNISNLKLKLPQKENSFLLLQEAVNVKTSENEKIKNNIVELENESSAVIQAESVQTNKINNLNSEIEHWTGKNEKKQRENFALKSEIVSSPEKIVQERKNLLNQLNKLRDEFSIKNSFIDNKRSFIVKYENLRNYLKQIIGKPEDAPHENADVEKIIQDYFSTSGESDFLSLTQIKKLQNLISTMSQKVNSQMESIEILDEKLAMEGRTLQQLQETMNKKSNYHKMLKAECELKEKQVEMETLKQKKSAQVVSENILNIRGNIDILRTKINELQEKMENRREQEKTAEQAMLKNLCKLHEKIGEY